MVLMVLIERCRTCKNNWDGHCIVGNDIWKMKNSNKEVECEEYEQRVSNIEGLFAKQGDELPTTPCNKS